MLGAAKPKVKIPGKPEHHMAPISKADLTLTLIFFNRKKTTVTSPPSSKCMEYSGIQPDTKARETESGTASMATQKTPNQIRSTNSWRMRAICACNSSAKPDSLLRMMPFIEQGPIHLPEMEVIFLFTIYFHRNASNSLATDTAKAEKSTLVTSIFRYDSRIPTGDKKTYFADFSLLRS